MDESMQMGEKIRMVLMEDLSSGEHYVLKEEKLHPVLSGINLSIKKAEAWGICGRSSFEIKLLLEIMANIRAYDQGRCVLMERGMMRHKRVILDHVFYIGTSDMLYNNMNVLEFLMFAAAKLGFDPVDLQEQLFEYLIDTGLGYISLTPIAHLTKEEKGVITLIAAAHSDSMMIIFNLPEYDFDERLIHAIARTADFIRTRERTLILGTWNSQLIEKACTHTAYVSEGALIYQGSVEELRFKHDKVVLTIRDKAIDSLEEQLVPLLPEHRLYIKNDTLFISSRDPAQDPGPIYKIIIEAGFIPDHMEVNPKTVENAYEEIVRQHDLQKQLFQERASTGL